MIRKLFVAAAAVSVALPIPAYGQTGDLFDIPGLSFGKGLSGPNALQGGSISYSTTSGQGPQLTSQFGLEYQRLIIKPSEYTHSASDTWSFDTSIDSNLLVPDPKKNDYLNFRIGIDQLHQTDPLSSSGWSLFQRYNALLETSEDINVKNLLFEYEITPIYLPWALYSRKATGIPGVSFALQPVVDLQAGTSLSGRSLTEEKDQTKARVIPTFGGTLYFTDLVKNSPFKDLFLSVSDKLSYLPFEKTKTFNYVDATLNFVLVKAENGGNAVSVAPEIKAGALAPYYKQSTTLLLQLNIAIGTPGVSRSYQ